MFITDIKVPSLTTIATRKKNNAEKMSAIYVKQLEAVLFVIAF